MAASNSLRPRPFLQCAHSCSGVPAPSCPVAPRDGPFADSPGSCAAPHLRVLLLPFVCCEACAVGPDLVLERFWKVGVAWEQVFLGSTTLPAHSLGTALQCTKAFTGTTKACQGIRRVYGRASAASQDC